MNATNSIVRAARAASHRRTATAIAVLAFAAGSVDAAVGAKIAFQSWNPAHPEQERMVIPYDSASGVSDAVIAAWNEARELLCDQIRTELGKSDRFEKGVTFYKIDCRLQPAVQFSVRQRGPNELEFRASLKRNLLIASATTPTFLNKDFDPRVSLDFDVDLSVSVALQPSTAQTFKISGIYAGFSGTKFDSQNWTADVLKATSSAFAFLTGIDFKRMAESTLNGVNTATPPPRGLRPTKAMAAIANDLLAPVNAALQVPANYVQIGAWFHHDKIVLAFAPRNLPAPVLAGSAEGTIRWPAGLLADAGCQGFLVASQVQVAPSPITGPDLGFGSAPMRSFGSYAAPGQPVLNGERMECRYRLSGLPAMYANRLVAATPRLVVPSARPVSTSASVDAPVSIASLRVDGWSGSLVPPADASGRDFLAVVQTINPSVPIAQRPAIAQPQPTALVPVRPMTPVGPIGPTPGPVFNTPRVVTAPVLQQPVRLPVAPRLAAAPTR